MAMVSVQSLLSLSNLKDELDNDFLHCVMQLTYSHEAMIKTRELKEKGNANFMKGGCLLASNLYEKALQYVCVGLSSREEEGLLMNDFVIYLNLN